MLSRKGEGGVCVTMGVTEGREGLQSQERLRAETGLRGTALKARMELPLTSHLIPLHPWQCWQAFLGQGPQQLAAAKRL